MICCKCLSKKMTPKKLDEKTVQFKCECGHTHDKPALDKGKKRKTPAPFNAKEKCPACGESPSRRWYRKDFDLMSYECDCANKWKTKCADVKPKRKKRKKVVAVLLAIMAGIFGLGGAQQ